MAETDERDIDGGDVERYEALRAQALRGEPAGWRHGLALLEGRGMAAWLRVCRSIPQPCSPSARLSGAAQGVDGELVGVLAAMARAVVG